MLSTIQNTSKYTAKILNISQNKNISDFIDRLDVDLPKAREISSLNAKFVLDEKLINDGNEIEIQVLDEVGNSIYSFTGKATLDSTVYPYTNNNKFSYVIKDSYSKLFEKVVAETEVFYDLYFCNNQDKNNSLMHVVANKLGFTDLIFEDMKFENAKYMRVPFVIFRENERWIDELQTLIVATNSILYVHNKKLYFRACNQTLKTCLKFDKTNIITNIEKRFKPKHSNGIKVLYDRYKKLDNQVVFNLKSKEIINPNTKIGANVKAARINYITSSVSNPVITKASGYYFTSDSTKSLVRVDLKEGTHYTLEEFTETQCIAKFYNPYSYTLYIDNFEIKGIPLVMYKDNNAIVKSPNVVDKNQENFEVIPKNKYVQTLEMAKKIAKLEYANRIESKYSYTFDTVFLPNVQLGEIYELEIKDIKTKVRVNSFSIHLKPGDFRMKLHCDEVSEVGTVKTGNTDSLTPATQFVNLSNIEKQIDETKAKTEKIKESVEITNQKMNSVLHKGETAPTENIKEYDCWHNAKTNEWKQYLNGKWSPVPEKDILPAMKHFNSLEEAKLSLGQLGNKIGSFLINEGEKLGAINGVVAESSIDKKGTVTLKNVNNLLAFNVQNPANPNDIKSKFFMGVSNVNTVPSNIVFKIGEAEVTGSTIEMEDTGKINIKFSKKELSEKLSEVDKNINNNKKILEEKIDKQKENIDEKFKNSDKKFTILQGKYEETTQDISNFKTQTSKRVDTVQGALENGDLKVTGNTVFDGSARFVSKGTNEVITIANGSIDFHRDGKKLTQLKNIRYGTILTDSKGKGIVNFEGFKQPMILQTSIKSVNFGKNMASEFCYAEHIEDCKYRFYVGGTTEEYKEAKPVKVIGNKINLNNVTSIRINSVEFYIPKDKTKIDIESDRTSDALGIDYFNGKGKKRKVLYGYLGGNDYWEEWAKDKALFERKITYKYPKIKITLLLTINSIKEVIFSETKTLDDIFDGISIFFIDEVKYHKNLTFFRKFNTRSNVEISLEIEIIESNYIKDGARFWSVTHDGTSARPYKKTNHYVTFFNDVVCYTLTPSKIRNKGIEYSAETSTISDTAGYGEVSYIAMEVD